VEALGRIKQIWLSLLEEFEAFLKQFQQNATQSLEKFKAPNSRRSLVLNDMDR
jgi:hypothetical protein